MLSLNHIICLTFSNATVNVAVEKDLISCDSGCVMTNGGPVKYVKNN